MFRDFLFSDLALLAIRLLSFFSKFGTVLEVWNFCVKFFKLIIQQISLLQIYQLPTGWMKDGTTWTMEFRENDAWVLSNGN